MDEGFRAGAFDFLRAIEDDQLNWKSVYANGTKSRRAKTALLLMLRGNTRSRVLAEYFPVRLLLNNTIMEHCCCVKFLS